MSPRAKQGSAAADRSCLVLGRPLHGLIGRPHVKRLASLWTDWKRASVMRSLTPVNFLHGPISGFESRVWTKGRCGKAAAAVVSPAVLAASAVKGFKKSSYQLGAKPTCLCQWKEEKQSLGPSSKQKRILLPSDMHLSGPPWASTATIQSARLIRNPGGKASSSCWHITCQFTSSRSSRSSSSSNGMSSSIQISGGWCVSPVATAK